MNKYSLVSDINIPKELFLFVAVSLTIKNYKDRFRSFQLLDVDNWDDIENSNYVKVLYDSQNRFPRIFVKQDKILRKIYYVDNFLPAVFGVEHPHLRIPECDNHFTGRDFSHFTFEKYISVLHEVNPGFIVRHGGYNIDDFNFSESELQFITQNNLLLPTHYIDYEYIVGRQYCDVLAELSENERSQKIISLVKQYCEEAAKMYPYVHGDWNTSNVIQTKDGTLKMIDFDNMQLVDSVESASNIMLEKFQQYPRWVEKGEISGYFSNESFNEVFNKAFSIIHGHPGMA